MFAILHQIMLILKDEKLEMNWFSLTKETLRYPLHLIYPNLSICVFSLGLQCQKFDKKYDDTFLLSGKNDKSSISYLIRLGAI